MTSTTHTDITKATVVPTTPSTPSLTQRSTLQGSNAGGSRISVNDALPITDQPKSGASSLKNKSALPFLQQRFALDIIQKGEASERDCLARIEESKRRRESKKSKSKDLKGTEQA